MPYDKFVKAQKAADLMPDKDREKLLPGRESGPLHRPKGGGAEV